MALSSSKKSLNLRNTANYTPHFFPTDSSDLSRRQFGSSLKPLLFLIWFSAYKMKTTRTKRCWAAPSPRTMSAWKYNSVLTWNIQLSRSYFIKTKARQCKANNYRCTINCRSTVSYWIWLLIAKLIAILFWFTVLLIEGYRLVPAYSQAALHITILAEAGYWNFYRIFRVFLGRMDLNKRPKMSVNGHWPGSQRMIYVNLTLNLRSGINHWFFCWLLAAFTANWLQ